MQPTLGKAKKKLIFSEMIDHLESKGVLFNVIKKDAALRILEETNYYYKLTAYKKNFQKNHNDKYVNLEFAYLYDLSTIDMRLRYITLQMCLDIEHALKVKILRDITNNDQEDGYVIVADFLSTHKLSIEECMPGSNSKTHYNDTLIRRHRGQPAVWIIFETMTFGQFSRFVEFYKFRNGMKDPYYKDISEVIRYIKNIRNAAAHSHPVIMDVAQSRNDRTSRVITSFVKDIPTISSKMRNNKLRNRKVHDLVALLFTYNQYITSAGMKSHRYQDIGDLLQRCKRNQEFYTKNNSLTSVHDFFSKIIDFIK